MKLLLIICTVYAVLYGQVIIERVKQLCLYVAGDAKNKPRGADAKFIAGTVCYTAAISVVASEVLQFIWSLY